MSKIESFKDLIVYQKAYKLAMEIFETPKSGVVKNLKLKLIPLRFHLLLTTFYALRFI